jgi:flagellar protein FliS
MALTITSDSYRDELLGANPNRMVVMIYDEVLEALRTAVDAIERGDIEGRYNAVTVATELLATLYACLDPEKGGEIAENLGAIYSVILRYLPQVNIHNDAEVAKRAMALLLPLRNSWVQLEDMEGVVGSAVNGRPSRPAPAVQDAWDSDLCRQGVA